MYTGYFISNMINTTNVFTLHFVEAVLIFCHNWHQVDTRLVLGTRLLFETQLVLQVLRYVCMIGTIAGNSNESKLSADWRLQALKDLTFRYSFA